MSFMTSKIRSVLLASAMVCMVFPAVAAEQFFPLQSYRVGPYAAGGTGFFGGFIDYSIWSTRETAALVVSS